MSNLGGGPQCSPLTSGDELGDPVEADWGLGQLGPDGELLDKVRRVERAQVVHVKLVHRVCVTVVLVRSCMAQRNAEVARHLRTCPAGAPRLVRRRGRQRARTAAAKRTLFTWITPIAKQPSASASLCAKSILEWSQPRFRKSMPSCVRPCWSSLSIFSTASRGTH